MIKSMTAFARAEMEQEDLSVMIEIRSYNSRNLDIVLHMPHEYLCFEEKIRNLLANRIARGRISVYLEIKNKQDALPDYEVDIPKASAYYQALSKVKKALQIKEEIPLTLVLTEGDIIKPGEVKPDMEQWQNIVLSCLNQAVDHLDDMRKREGDFLAQDLGKRLDFLEGCIEEIESASTDLIAHYQQHLKERISRLTQGAIELDPDRITQEAAFLADKSDISEEIVRVKSHIEQFRFLVNDGEPAGRKLNFLLQEFNREFNTIGSKTGNASVPYRIVDAKSEIEKMREQIQNVE